MPSIFPSISSGAVVVRDLAGVCQAPVNTFNAYCPPEEFTTSCQVTALPEDCVARITPTQINGIVSELLCLAVHLVPDGSWDCDSNCNLGTMFSDWWTANIPQSDGITITGNGQPETPFAIIPMGVVEAFCADNDVITALAACLISEDVQNIITPGSDGKLLARIFKDGGIIIGAGTVDDPLMIDVEEAQIQLGISPAPYREAAGNTLITTDDHHTIVQMLGDGSTATFDSAVTLGDTFGVDIWVPYGVAILIDPAGAETINGLTQLWVQGGHVATVWSDGTNLKAKLTADSRSGPQNQGFTFGLGMSSAAANALTVATGAAASDTANYTLMELLAPITKLINANWVAGDNAGGLDVGAVAANTQYYAWLIRNPTTNVRDVLLSASNTAPTMPAGFTQKRLIGPFFRTAATNIVPPGLQRKVATLAAYTTLATDTALDYPIPPSAQKIVVKFVGVQLSGTDNLIVQGGVASAAIAAGYVQNANINVAGSNAFNPGTAGFVAGGAAATRATSGTLVLTRIRGTNTWVAALDAGSNSPTNLTWNGGGHVALAGALNMLRITRTGTNTFAAGGVVQVEYEYE
jgi:hypothetical protein